MNQGLAWPDSGRLLLAFACLALLGVAACDGEGPIPDADLQIQIEIGVEEVELGRGFPLAVTRIWSKQFVPVDFSEAALEPLAVRLVRVDRREDERRVQETRRYRAFAFSLDDVTLEGISFQAYPRDGGPAREARASAINLEVLPSLDPERPGAPELPRPPFRPPVPRLALAGALTLALAAGVLLWRRARARRLAPPPPPPEPAPHERALARLASLAARACGDGDEAGIQAFHVEASSLLRDYLEERFEACRPEMTTEEFLESPRTAGLLSREHREFLARFLSACDLVKFGRAPSTGEVRAGLLALAEAFVRETQAGEEEA